MNILVLTEKPFAPEAVEEIKNILSAEGHSVTVLEKYSPEQLAQALPQADALIVRSDKVTADTIAAAPNLKIIVRAGAGYDNIDLQAASKAGIIVENTPGQNSNAVAELVIGLLIMAARNMYTPSTGSELKNKTLGLQAFGQVSRNVARIAQGLGMQISALDPYCPDQTIQQAGVTPVHDIQQLYKNNQIISLHIPATPQTRGSINYNLITLMPKGAIIINTARKEIIDEPGLKQALNDRPDLKYLADVAPDNAQELLQLFPGRVFFTPKKMGAQTAEANLNAAKAAAQQIASYLKTGKPTFQVNK